jgi:hypothetical protein
LLDAFAVTSFYSPQRTNYHNYMITSTPDQISDRNRQQAAMRIQNHNLQRQLERRIQSAIALQDRNLISQLQAEQEFLQNQQCCT